MFKKLKEICKVVSKSYNIFMSIFLKNQQIKIFDKHLIAINIVQTLQ